LGTLAGGQSAPALASTPDGQWIQIEVPGQPGVMGWVFAQLVRLANAEP
jgi:hypothetical protein